MKRPLVQLALVLIAGVIVGNYFDASLIYAKALCFFFLVLAFVLLILGRRGNLLLLLIGAALFFCGAYKMSGYVFTEQWPVIPLENRWGLSTKITGTICKFPDRYPGKVKFVLCEIEVEEDIEKPPPGARVILTAYDQQQIPGYGERVQVKSILRQPSSYANPGGFDYRRFLLQQKIFATATPAGRSKISVIDQGNGSTVLLFVDRIREYIRSYLDEHFAVAEKEIIKALILGEKHLIPDEIQESFRITGLAHILAISGFHVGIVGGVAFLLIWSLLTISTRVVLAVNVLKMTALLSMIPVVGYVLISGMGISTLRAGIMLGTYFLAIILDRQRDIPSSVSAAAIFILLFDPTALYSVSFRLSFVAIIGIFTVLGWLNDSYRQERNSILLRGRYRWLTTYIVVSLAANLSTMPIIAYTFNRISLIGFIANLIFVPILGVIAIQLVILGTVSLIVSPYLATPFYYSVILVFKGCVKAMAWISELPYAAVYVPTLRWWEVAFIYLLLLSLLYLRRVKWAKRTAPAAVIALLISFILVDQCNQFKTDYRATFLDVGQGDATLIELKGSPVKRVLIDGGGVQRGLFDVGKAVVAPFLWHKRIKHLDVVVLTHPHPDHFDGLRFILKNFSVGEFWHVGQEVKDPRFKDLLIIVSSKKIPIRIVDNEFSSRDPALQSLEILFPPPNMADRKSLFSEWRLNDKSLVLRLSHESAPLLLAGDAETNLENWLLQNKVSVLHGALLKIGHHGGDSSGQESFLKAVDPSAVAIFCSRYNKYKAPAKNTLKRIENFGALIYRTDIHGAVEVTPRTGGGINIRTVKGP